MTGNLAEVLRLRGELEARFGRAIVPGAAPVPERFDGFRTGIAAIDALLPDGVQRGTLSLWTGEATAGRTAALRALVLHSCAEGARVAVVDASLTLDATFGCTPEGAVEGLWVVRPPDADRAAEGAWAAEALLRAGVFDLVIVDGCPLEPAGAHRLRALARERNAGVVVSGARSEERGASNIECLTGSRSHAPGTGISRRLALHASAMISSECARSTPPEKGNAAPGAFDHRDTGCSLLAPRSSLLDFRADVRLEFRRGGRTAGEGLLPGGRFRQRARVVLAKGGSSAPAAGEREVEVVHEPTDRLRSHIPAPDRSPGGR
jgi:hypothetical protein